MKLEDINKDKIFKVPDNYFDDFPDRIQKRIMEEEKEKNVPFLTIRSIINFAAAAVILMFVIYGVIQYNDQSTSIDQLLSDVSTEELVNYLEESDISAEELLENLDISLIASDDYSEAEEFLPSDPLDEETLDDLLDEYEIEMQYL